MEIETPTGAHARKHTRAIGANIVIGLITGTLFICVGALLAVMFGATPFILAGIIGGVTSVCVCVGVSVFRHTLELLEA